MEISLNWKYQIRQSLGNADSGNTNCGLWNKHDSVQEVTLETFLTSIKSLSSTNIGLYLMQEVMGGHLSCLLKQPRNQSWVKDLILICKMKTSDVKTSIC